MVTPANLFQLHLGDLLTAGDGRTDIGGSTGRTGRTIERLRGQRRGLRSSAERGRASRSADGKLQKIAAFHDIFLSGEHCMMQSKCRAHDMNCG